MIAGKEKKLHIRCSGTSYGVRSFVENSVGLAESGQYHIMLRVYLGCFSTTTVIKANVLTESKDMVLCLFPSAGGFSTFTCSFEAPHK